MTDLEMETKIKTWGHTNDFNNKEWYINKWLNWNLNTLNLHPTDPKHWKKAIEFPYEQPNFAKKFKYDIKLTFPLHSFYKILNVALLHK